MRLPTRIDKRIHSGANGHRETGAPADAGQSRYEVLAHDSAHLALGRYADGRGVLYVGSMAAGNVYAVELEQGRAKAVRTIASDLLMPVGAAYRDGCVSTLKQPHIHIPNKPRIRASNQPSFGIQKQPLRGY